MCTKIIKYCGTSTNIRRHLKKCHCKAFAELKKNTQEHDETESESEIDDPANPDASTKRIRTRSHTRKGIKKYFKADPVKRPEFEAGPSTSSEAGLTTSSNTILLSESDTVNDVEVVKISKHKSTIKDCFQKIQSYKREYIHLLTT